MPKIYSGNSGPSINRQITEADSVSDIYALLAKGRAFHNFTRRTENRWNRTAKRRIAELNGGTQ